MPNEKLFAPKKLEEYEVLRLAMPSYLPAQRAIKKPIAEYIRKNPNQDVYEILEAGFGTLTTTEIILNINPKIQVIGYDNSPEMFQLSIQKMRGWADKNGGKVCVGDSEIHAAYNQKVPFAVYYFGEKPRVSIFNTDFVTGMIPLDDDYFDGFASGFVLHNLTKKQRAAVFQELSRIIKASGIFVNADKYAQDDATEYKKNYDRQLHLFDRFVKHGYPHLTPEWTEHYVQDEKIKFTESEQKKLFQKNGFSDVHMIYRGLMDGTMVATKL